MPAPAESTRGAERAACTCANLRQAARAVTRLYDGALRPAGLKATQFTLLATLAQTGALPPTRLAAALVMDRTTLTRNLKPLLAGGLVRVEPGADQRVRRIALTDAGRDRLERAVPLWRTAQSRLVDSLGHGRWSALLADLRATVALVRHP